MNDPPCPVQLIDTRQAGAQPVYGVIVFDPHDDVTAVAIAEGILSERYQLSFELAPSGRAGERVHVIDLYLGRGGLAELDPATGVGVSRKGAGDDDVPGATAVLHRGQLNGEDLVAGYPHLLHHGSDERWVSDTFSSLSLIPQCERTGT